MRSAFFRGLPFRIHYLLDSLPFHCGSFVLYFAAERLAI